VPSSNVQFLTLKYYSGYVVKILDFISYLTPQLATHSFVFPLSSYKKHNTYTFMYINIGSLLSSTALNSFSTEKFYVLYIGHKTEIRINVREFISQNEQVDLLIV